MPTDSATGLLPSLAVLRIAGADAGKFLQGQLSNDMERLDSRQLLHAGLHNAQGRVIALLLMTRASGGDVISLLPASVAPLVVQHLRRFVLRARVSITDDTGAWRIYGVIGGPPAVAEGVLVLGWPGATPRSCLLQPADQSPLAEGHPDFAQRWQALQMADGIARVEAFNSGQFVAQMLNLDCIDAISFDKGCYTGQEIIARAHYRGRVKRRMQRFISESAANLQAGTSLTLHDGRDAVVVDALLHADGRSEFLAVTTWPAPEPAATVDGLHCTTLPLPYPLPP